MGGGKDEWARRVRLMAVAARTVDAVSGPKRFHRMACDVDHALDALYEADETGLGTGEVADVDAWDRLHQLGRLELALHVVCELLRVEVVHRGVRLQHVTYHLFPEASVGWRRWLVVAATQGAHKNV